MTEESATEKAPFHLDLHAWIESQQTAHGVRHDDFSQYHAYCTRRLSRLSHHPDAKKYLACSSKFAADKSAAKGKGRHAFCSRQADTFAKDKETGELAVPHSSILWYLVVLAERSWAHANMLQRQKNKRQNVLRKLKKAQGWALKLVEMAKDHTDELTYQECRAYASWMTANFALEKMEYQKASTEYANAMSLCHKLSQQHEGEDATMMLERQDLFVNRADTVLRPLFRYCQYELKEAGHATMDEPRLNTDTRKVPTEEETSISFRGHELVLESKQLRVLLLKLQSMQQDELENEEEKRDHESSFLNALSVLDDALDVVQSSLNMLEHASTGPAVQAKRKQQLLWKGYLQSEKTKRVMLHTQELLKEISGHAERVHVYDALLQHAQSLLDLPIPSQYGEPTANADEEEEDEFALQGQANVLRLRALKAYHMAWYYYEKPKKYEAALALIQQSKNLSKRAKEEIAACDEDMPQADEYLKELEELPIASAFAAINAAMYLQKKHGRQSGGQIQTNRPLLLRLHEEDSGPVLAEVTPMPMPCKPAFFDLAYGYAMDSVESVENIQAYVDRHTFQPDVEAGTAQASSGGGIFGWLTGSSES